MADCIIEPTTGQACLDYLSLYNSWVDSTGPAPQGFDIQPVPSDWGCKAFIYAGIYVRHDGLRGSGEYYCEGEEEPTITYEDTYSVSYRERLCPLSCAEDHEGGFVYTKITLSTSNYRYEKGSNQTAYCPPGIYRYDLVWDNLEQEEYWIVTNVYDIIECPPGTTPGPGGCVPDDGGGGGGGGDDGDDEGGGGGGGGGGPTGDCCEYYDSTYYEKWRDYYPTCMRSYPKPEYPGLTLKAGNKLILPEPDTTYDDYGE